MATSSETPNIGEFLLDAEVICRCLDAMQMAVGIVRVECDGKGEPCDLQYIYCNEPMAKIQNIARERLVGSWYIRDLRRDIDRAWVDFFARVASTGKKDCRREYAPHMGVHLEAEAWRVCEGYCVTLISNITERLALEDRLRDQQNAVDTLMSNELTAFFFYDMDKCILYNNMHSSINKVISGGRALRLKNIPYSLAEMRILRPEDVHLVLRNLLNPLDEGRKETSMEIMLNISLDGKGHWKWYKVSFYRFQSAMPNTRKAVCTVRKIQKEVDLRNRLRRKADMDLSTGLYNRHAAVEFINNHLQSNDESCLLYLFDIDNFKGINDTWGHMEGDRVIAFFAKTLMEVMQNHIVFRLGGDEFAAFGQGQTYESVEKLAARMQKELDEQKEFDFPLHCSVGIAWCRRSCIYETLYAEADKMLYKAKEAGRRTWRATIVRPGYLDGK